MTLTTEEAVVATVSTENGNVSAPAPRPRTDWKERAQRAEEALNQVFGSELVEAWAEGTIVLPPAAPDPPGTIVLEGRIDKTDTARGKEGARTRVVVSMPLRGSPIAELAELSEKEAMFIRISPRITQQALGFSYYESGPAVMTGAADSEPREEADGDVIEEAPAQ